MFRAALIAHNAVNPGIYVVSLDFLVFIRSPSHVIDFHLGRSHILLLQLKSIPRLRETVRNTVNDAINYIRLTNNSMLVQNHPGI